MAHIVIAYPNNQISVEAEESEADLVAQMKESPVVTVTRLERSADTGAVQTRTRLNYNRDMVLLVDGGPLPEGKGK